MNLQPEKVKKLVENFKPTSAESLRIIVEENLGIFVSTSTILRFLKSHEVALYSIFISNDELETNVAVLTEKLGGTYGRKTMKGALTSVGINASQRRISKCLRKINPDAYIHRALHSDRALNPMRYRAPHFGYNLHLDQNEKLVDYGCVVVLAVDGHSNFLVAGTYNNVNF
jgi:hypothetical protein